MSDETKMENELHDIANSLRELVIEMKKFNERIEAVTQDGSVSIWHNN